MTAAQQRPISSPFGARSTAADVLAGVDLSGKTALVTGASSGLGIDTARALAAAGAAVILPVRSREKGEAAAAEIRASAPAADVQLAEMDLGDFGSVKKFAEGLAASGRPLHFLINNAGIMACPLRRTPEGYESQFATNHLGHFLLTSILLPLLRAGAPARVVQLSSTGHRLSPIHFEDIHYQQREYDRWTAYGQSKTANALFAVELDRRHRPEGIQAFSVHPGGIMTGLQKELSREEMIAMGWFDKDGKMHPLFKSTAQGAATSVWAATSRLIDGTGGLYLEDCNISALADASTPPFQGIREHAVDPAAAERLWVISQEMLTPWLARKS